MQLVRVLILALCGFLVYSNSSAQKLFRSPDEYINEGQAIVKIIGKVDDKIACFLDDYEGYKIIWYDAAMRKWGTSALDFLDKTTTDIKFQAGQNSVYVYHQHRNKKVRTLYASEIVPIHRDTIKPLPIDSINLETVRDRTRFAMISTNKRGVMAYSLAAYELKERKYGYAVKTVQRGKIVNDLAQGSFKAAAYNRILNVHLTRNGKGYVFFGEPGNASSSYQNLLAAYPAGGAHDVEYTSMDLNENIVNPILYYDKFTNKMNVGATLFTNRPHAGNSLWQSSFSYDNNLWSKPTIANIKVDEEPINLYRTRLRNFIPKSDGGGTFFLEKSYEEVQTRGRSMAMMPSGMLFGGGTYNYSVFHNDQVYAISVDGKGIVEWQREVLKTQESSENYNPSHSYGMLQYPIGNILLYTTKAGGENRFITSYLSKDGVLQQRQFSSVVYSRMEDDDILIQQAEQISANEIIFPVLQRRTISFAKIEF